MQPATAWRLAAPGADPTPWISTLFILIWIKRLVVQIHSPRPLFLHSKTEYVSLPFGWRVLGVASKPAPFAKTAKDAAPAPVILNESRTE